MNTKVTCDICKKEFQLLKSYVKEQRVTLENDKRAYHKDVILTFLMCPHCGKEYPVVMDDEETLGIVGKVKELFSKRMSYVTKQKPIPDKLDQKYYAAKRKLTFKRHELAEKFSGSFYQSEDGKQQLDYRYHER